MSWTIVECDFESANETINFGSRILAEGDGLYESNTLAIVSSSNEVISSPQVDCLNYNGKMFMAIDETFRVFEENCSVVVLFASFNDSINCFAVSEDSNIAILCLQDGNIHALHVETGGKLICSTFLKDSPAQAEKKMYSGIYFLQNEEQDSATFILVTHEKRLYRLTINNIEELYKNLLEDSVETANFSFEPIENENYESEIQKSLYDNVICQLPKFYKQYFTDSTPWIIALDEQGFLIAICRLTNIIFPIFKNEKIKDFVFLEGSDRRLLILTEPEDDVSYIKLLSFPCFQMIYQMQVSSNTYLVQLGTDKDELMFVDGVIHPGNQYAQELRIKVITESHVEDRLQRILKRKQFSEAEKFAKSFRLDLQDVYKARAEEYLVSLSMDFERVRELLEILDNINDVKFVVMCCLNSSPNSLSGIESALEYALNRILEAMKNNPDDNSLTSEKSTILNSLNKLEIFKLLNIFVNRSKQEELMNRWIDFLHSDLLKEMEIYFRNEDIDRGTLIFTRLDENIKNNLDIENIKEILQSIPKSVQLKCLLPWMKYLLQFVIETGRNWLTFILQWVCSRVRLSERTEPNNWAVNALDFLNRILVFLQSSFNAGTEFRIQNIGCDLPLNEVKNLISSLEEMATLEQRFNIKINLEEYTQDAKTVIGELLNIISLNILNDFMEDFFYKYTKDHNLNSDKVLMDYIETTVVDENTLEEGITVAFLKYIHSNNIRLEATLVILKHAVVPWSSVISNLAEEALKEQHPHVDKIREQKKYVVIKLLSKKYGVKQITKYTDNEVMFLVRRILRVQNSDMLKDIEVISSWNPALKEQCSVHTFNHFVFLGEFDKALKYLNSLEAKLVIRCSMSILRITQMYIDTSKWFDDKIMNYLEILNSCVKKLEPHMTENDYEMYKLEVEKLKNKHILKIAYNCDISVKDFDPKNHFVKLIGEIVSSFHVENDSNWQNLCAKCAKMARLVGLKWEEGVFELIKHVRTIKCLIDVAEYFMEYEADISSITKILVKIFIFISELKQNEDTLQNLALNTSETTTDILVSELLTVADRVCVQAAVIGENSLQSPFLDILVRWCWVWRAMHLGGAALGPATEKFGDWRRCSIYTPDVVWPASAHTVASCVGVLVTFLRFADCEEDRAYLINQSERLKSWASSHKQNLLLYLNYFYIHLVSDAFTMHRCTNLLEEFLNYLQKLPFIVHDLQSEGYDLTAYHLINTLKSSLSLVNLEPQYSTHVRKTLQTLLLNRIVLQLLAKVVASRRPDQLLALSLLQTDGFQPFRWIRSAFKMYRKDPRKLWTVSTLGCQYLEVQGNRGETYQAYTMLRLRCEWWRLWLSHADVPFNDTFQLNPDEIILSHLLKSRDCSLKFLKKFCADFSLDVQKYLPQLLRNSLLYWKPEIEPPESVGFKSPLIIKNCETDLIKRCTDIVLAMQDRKSVIEQLNAAWNEVSYYQYEVYNRIFEILEKVGASNEISNHKFLLQFFKNYTRITKPRHWECQAYLSVWQSARSLDPLSNYRLPFLPALGEVLHDVWRVLRDELNVYTYTPWLETAHSLGLQEDDVCTYAIKSVIHSGILSNQKGGDKIRWCVYSRHAALVKAIGRCASHMSNAEMCVAALYEAVWACAPGADQAALAELCWRRARDWRRALQEPPPNGVPIGKQEQARVRTVFEKVKRIYLECSIMQILFTNDLGQEKYLELIGQCDALIRALYQDERIVNCYEINTCPDINRVVDEVSQLYEVNAVNIRLELVREYLEDTRNDTPGFLDDSFVNFNAQKRKTIKMEKNTYKKGNDSLKRVVYICNSKDSNIWQNALWTLSQSTFDETITQEMNSSASIPLRARTLQCLLAITDREELQNITGNSYDDFCSYLEVLQILAHLDTLSIILNAEELEHYDKVDLIRKVLQSRNDPKLSAILAAKLAIRYDVWRSPIWEKILNAFIKLNMIDEILEYLPKLHGKLFGASFERTLESGWQTVLDHKFLKLSEDKSPQSISENLIVLQACPVLTNLDDCLMKIFNRCFNFNCFEACAMLLPYIKKTESKNEILSVLNPHINEELFTNIQNLSCYGVLYTDIVRRIFKKAISRKESLRTSK